MTIHICVCVCMHTYLSKYMLSHLNFMDCDSKPFSKHIFTPHTKVNTSEQSLPLLIWTRAFLIPLWIRIIWQWDPHSTCLPFGTVSMPLWSPRRYLELACVVCRAEMQTPRALTAGVLRSNTCSEIQQEKSVLGDSCTHGIHLLQLQKKTGVKPGAARAWALNFLSELTQMNIFLHPEDTCMQYLWTDSLLKSESRDVFKPYLKLAGSPKKSPCSILNR